MSGGSLDYLYSKGSISYEDLWKFNRVRTMLEGLGLQKTKLYEDIVPICEALVTAYRSFEDMKDVLHDCEFFISGDYEEDHLCKRIEEYEDR